MDIVVWLWPLACYLLGSISFAYFAGRFNGVDLRQHGSKNLGATNAGRVLGRKWFFVVFTLDLAKGALAVAVAQHVPATDMSPTATVLLPYVAAAAAVLGHSFTCFHGFKGGKAVATSLGAIIMLAPKLAGYGAIVWVVVWIVGWLVFRAKKSNAVGPASVCASLILPIIHLYTAEFPWRMPELALTIFIFALSVLIIVRHRSNIARLFAR
jgi:acyl phosphate:glycerol-3-phosphate acyltransferase